MPNIVVAVLAALADDGLLSKDIVASAVLRYGIDPSALDPNRTL